MAPGPATPAMHPVLAVPIHLVDYAQTLRLIQDWLDTGRDGTQIRMHHICTVNPEFIMAAQNHDAFRAVLQASDLNVPDGFGVILALYLYGLSLPGWVTGTDLIPHLARLAAEKGWRIFLLGARPGVACRAAGNLESWFPGLRICGTHSGSPRDSDWPEIQRRLAESRPHILLVAFGHPRQDLWIAQHREHLVGMVAMGVGGAFDFLAGDIRRAPLWLRRMGLEWLFRLLLQPSRWRRMICLPQFVLLVVWRRLRVQT